MLETYRFSDELADRAELFFERELRYVEGEKAGQPFVLESWQAKIVRDLFGWVREDGSRRYRTAFIEIPRKNGKSTLSAGLALYLLLRDGEARPQVFSAAGDRGQARIVFKAAREMIMANGRLQLEGDLRQYEIRGIKNGGWYEALSAEAYTKHGLSAHGIIFDELHVQPNRDLWDVLATSTGSRRQPLTIAITTAGHDRSTICWELRQRAIAALIDPDSDPTFYAAVWETDAAADWTDEDVWAKANPNLGISIKLDYLREACAAARSNPALENTFRNLHLNQWTEQAVRWIPMHLWDVCREDFDVEELKGRTCFAGLDLASTRDVSALVLLFPEDDGTCRVVPHFWVPEDSKDDRAHRDRRLILNWANKGMIERTPGNVCDYYRIAAHIEKVFEDFDVQVLAYDPWGPARALAQMLDNNGLDMSRIQEFRQVISNLAAPSKEFERLVTSGRLRHDGNPVLRWMVENTAAKRDINDNIRPDKEASADKIDGVVATIMALGLAITADNLGHCYDTPGSLAL